MNRIKTLIIDDEPLARSRIRELLVEDDEISIIGECSDGDEAVISIFRLKPDLVFLDVQMPERDGFEVVSTVGAENMPVVIFVTAFDRYALQAFEVYALDYLLKPFDDSRFFQTLERAKKQIRQTAQAEHDGGYKDLITAMIERVKPFQGFLQKVLVKSRDRLTFLETNEIEWISSEGNYVCFHIQKASYMLRETISNLEKQLNPAQFLRINRSTIININQVKELHQMFHGDYKVILNDNTQFTLSRRFRDRLPRIVTGS
jgi:two-component system, LytTR family, response regulator